MPHTFKRVLVTGAAGFIGSHLAEALVREGAEVVAFVRYSSLGRQGWLETLDAEVRREIEVVVGDLRDPHSVANAVRGCDTILHLGALIAIPFSYQSPDSYLETNIRGTLNILQAARQHEVARIVHSSTSEVYGSAQFVPITEEHPLVGQSPYSASKIGADQMAIAFERSFGTPVAVIRPFNTYGPRQSPRAVIPAIITQILAGQRRIKLGSLHPTRDFNYVTDTVAGFLAMARSDAAIGEVVNVGSNFEVSIGEVVETIAEVMGVEIEVESESVRVRPERSEVERLWASNEKAQRLLGWAPAYGGRDGFRRGIEKTVAWFGQHGTAAGHPPGAYAV